MNTPALREQIQLALVQEAEQRCAGASTEHQLDLLHPTIQLPASDAHGVLTRFVTSYVEQVPDVLDAAHAVAREAGIEAQAKPVLNLAEAFFLSPPALLDGHQGLEAILDEAYLAHRLVEEVNDRYILHFGQPLIPLDTTAANLVAHR